jgi:glycerate kinase
MPNVLITPDKFKGTLSAGQAAVAIARGWRQARRKDSIETVPMSDGGDGFGDAVSRVLGARPQSVTTVDAAHRSCRATWWWQAETRTAIIESAGIIGLAMLPPGEFHPFQLDTLGLADVIRAAAEKGAKRCLMGIGGSATNDGGFGLARGLGWEFLTARGDPIDHWTGLDRLERIHAPRKTRWFDEFLVAVDVCNPLLGPVGATRIYGPQKGVRPEDFRLAERGLRRLARVAREKLGRDFSWHAGAGAAGGLGFGLAAFPGARLEPGFALFARHAKLQDRLTSADLVITGEGAIDASSFMGKGVGEVAKQCQRGGIPCIALAGVANLDSQRKNFFAQLRALSDLTPVEHARAEPALWLERLAALAARDWNGAPC